MIINTQFDSYSGNVAYFTTETLHSDAVAAFLAGENIIVNFPGFDSDNENVFHQAETVLVTTLDAYNNFIIKSGNSDYSYFEEENKNGTGCMLFTREKNGSGLL